MAGGIPLLFNKADRELYRISEDTIQSYYRDVAEAYGESHHVALPGAQRFLADFESNLSKYITSESQVLEIGAGTGFGTNIVSKHASPAVIDASLEMLAINQKANPQLNMYACPTENLPFADNSFDVVIGNNTFYLVPDKQQGAKEIARVLKPGGRLLLSEMNPHHPLWPMMFTIKRRFFERTIYKCFPGQMKKRFGKVGMQLEDVDYYSYTPYFAGEGLLKITGAFQKLFGGVKLIRRFTAIRIWYVLKKD